MRNKKEKKLKLEDLEDWFNHATYHASQHHSDAGSIEEIICFANWREAGKPVVTWLKLPKHFIKMYEQYAQQT